MINILFFAKFREVLNTDSLELEAPSPVAVSNLMLQLSNKGESWQQIFSQDNLMIAVNQQICDMETIVKSGDEVAFFPPVTGG